jgi:sugar lactone lactonase YvrE
MSATHRSGVDLVSRSILLLGFILAGAPSAAIADGPESPPIRFVLEWGHRGKAPGEFNFPIGIVLDRDGTIYVSDFYNDRVQRFSPEGKFLSSFKTFPHPGGLAIDREGNLYITHFPAMKTDERPNPSGVTVYSSEGKLLREWGRTGKGDGELDFPGGIVVSPNGRVYVADQTNRRVQVFDTQGKLLGKWGEYGTKPGQFGGNSSAKGRVGGPQFVALDEEGNIYTTEGSMCRVQKFTAEGKFLLAWGEDSKKPGGFGGGWLGTSLRGAVGICIDDDGNVWVASVNGRVQQFSNTGKYLRGLTDEPGSEPGQFMAPHGVAIDPKGNLYVVDAYNHRIQRFATRR